MPMKYPALIDGEHGTYGVAFPDLPGVVAMGDTPDEAVRNAAEALEDFAAESRADGVELVPPSAAADVDVPRGCKMTTVSLQLAVPAG